MIPQLAKRLAMGRAAKQTPLFKVLAIAQVGLLARTHLKNLDGDERRRLVELARHGRSLSAPERDELRALTAKLDPRAFAGAAADQLSPFPLPQRLTGVPRKKR